VTRYASHPRLLVIPIILILLSGCATREDFNRSFIERYVQDDVYRNELKGFSMVWPDSEIWQFRNYPEYDLSFDHIDGRSQFLVLGVNGLIRREFPDDFHQWILDRLQARNITPLAHEEITHDPVEKFRIITECEFLLRFGESFGIRRTTDTLLLKKGSHWVAVICICPPENYPDKKPLFEAVFDNIAMM